MVSRRSAVRFMAVSAAASTLPAVRRLRAAPQSADGPKAVSVELPCNRVPVSFIIDDSTCLVNMGKFCMPQFAATYPQRKDYQKPWRKWPSEIPDAFVREFGQWCAAQGVRGKYSIVPYPACVGWLDRVLPGWSQQELDASLRLVRELMLPNWDIHPEMITHTRVIDLKTGRPMADYSPANMENSYPQQEVSVDYLASYLAYALRILKNCQLPCEGITTPGGFGNRVKQKLPVAVREAVSDVFGAEVPHYFKYVAEGEESTEPAIEAVEDRGATSPRFAVNIPAGTGDWFGGWDGVGNPEPDRYATQDATGGRMVELIEARRPAIMLCHWPGMYCNGSKSGFHAFQRVVQALHSRFADRMRWMKLSEIARYWAAREWTRIDMPARSDIEGPERRIALRAPLACPSFTVRLAGRYARLVWTPVDGNSQVLRRVSTSASLGTGSWWQDDDSAVACFDLPIGRSELALA